MVLVITGCSDSGSKDNTSADPGSNSETPVSEQTPEEQTTEQPTTYDITLTATDGGSLSLMGTQTVEEGTGFSVTITPYTGYKIESASGCGGTLADNTFTVAAIVADCSINASFARIEYTVTINASSNGSVTPDTEQTILHGDNLTLTVTPDSGYYASAITGCEGTRTDNEYSADIISDCTIDITFSAQITATAPLNDTGMTLCGNYDAENEDQWSSTLNCADVGATQSADGIDADGNPVPAGQDAHYGRDALAASGQLAKTGDGDAGFDFTKLDASGNDLPETAIEWSCVRDNVTGLIWEVKAPSNGSVGDSLHDADDRYNWYNTDSSTNGGSVGYADNDGAICYGYDNADTATYCNTEAFVNRVNAAGLCGANDWRMPKKEELRSIVHYGRISPCIDTGYFPNATSNWYWSGSPGISSSTISWVVNFDYGYDSSGSQYGNNHVRLVRSEP
jgi:hypothetical protein